jgi:hypothetical protein
VISSIAIFPNFVNSDVAKSRPEKKLAKFGYKPDMNVLNSKEPLIFLVIY